MSKPATYPDNPPRRDVKKPESSDPCWETMADDGARFEVLTDVVGTTTKGQIVKAKDFGPAAQIDRLISLGHVKPLSPREVAAAEAEYEEWKANEEAVKKASGPAKPFVAPPPAKPEHPSPPPLKGK